MNTAASTASDPNRDLLRHTIATLGYRGGKAVLGAPDGFATFRTNDTTRTPGEILAHIGDLLDWALCITRGEPAYKESPSLSWDEAVARFFSALEKFDSYLASDGPLACPAEKIFQGPIADALTHVGQISMLRRMAGAPVRGENYFKAEVVIGRVGSEQATERFEFE